ncbi:hypothetical protein LCGC14_3158770 [marine sediment metagenome]|uniref:Uncharacterized protein n=1 Tax=marine sediment metagenome TaxID=412755 RepID=A0A0F8VRV5_9ZZZZ
MDYTVRRDGAAERVQGGDVKENELEQRISEARPHWPMNIDSAWAVLPPTSTLGPLRIEGPLTTAEAAHRLSIPAGGFVLYNCPDKPTAMLIAELRCIDPSPSTRKLRRKNGRKGPALASDA